MTESTSYPFYSFIIIDNRDYPFFALESGGTDETTFVYELLIRLASFKLGTLDEPAVPHDQSESIRR